MKKLEILRVIAYLAEELKGTEIAKKAKQVMKGELSKIKLKDLIELKDAMENELKSSFIQKAFQ